MLPLLAPVMTEIWGPFRLLGSYMLLIGGGGTAAAVLCWFFLPRFWHRLPRDQGKPFVREGEIARGKPTGAGFFFVTMMFPVLFFVLPFSGRIWGVYACLYGCMLTGYLDDRSETPWGEWRKGLLDLIVAVVVSIVLAAGHDLRIWLPVIKGAAPDGSFVIPAWAFVIVSTALLWGCINATNCTDGVDGLAGSLTLLALLYLGGFLYMVIGHVDMAAYLLLPHNPDGALWAVLIFTAAGALAGYLWHNAKPSAVLMGDAGSRFLGLLIGVSVMASGNPALVVVVAPVILVNGGSGLVKLALLRGLRRLGFDVRPPNGPGTVAAERPNRAPNASEQHALIRLLHRVRFPLHDHCRRTLDWSDSQVLMRFVLLQAILTPLLLGLFVKLR